MNLALKLLFKNTVRFFKEKEYRSFYFVAASLGNKKRYTPGKIKVNRLVFNYCDALSFVWQYNEIFKDNYYYFKSNNTSPLIYDCGSNIGTSCIYFKQLYPSATIKAFEADPSIAKTLQQNMEANNLTGVEINNKAVWIDNNGIELTTDGADGASVYSVNTTKVKVASARLRELLDNETKQIDFLKMDIEGAEKQVITDCASSLKKIDHLFIEYHDFENVKQDLDIILATLTQNNFHYHVVNAHFQSSPFKAIDNNKNLQLNIFAKQIK